MKFRRSFASKNKKCQRAKRTHKNVDIFEHTFDLKFRKASQAKGGLTKIGCFDAHL